MATTRRDFLRAAVATGSILTLGAQARHVMAAADDKTTAPRDGGLKILILGGTAFLGPAIVEAAKARGHTLTLFNRGRTNPHLFPELEKLRGDRDPNKGEGIKALEGRKWDAVFDDCGYYPRMVKASAELLAPNVKQYVFISSISAYAENKTPGADETAAIGTMPDPTLEKMGENYEYYGPLKALCEQAAEKALSGRVTNVRPGYIVGPGDPTDRFTYWPVRVDQAKGDRAEVLAPGTPKDPIQIIDVRDLGGWLVHTVEQNITGVFNACGPEKALTMGEVLDACKSASASEARFTWVSADFLQKQSGEGVDVPIWISPEGDSAGFHRWSNAKAIKAGLKFRPVRQTVGDTLTWFKTLPPERQSKLRAGLSAEREAELLAAWHGARR